MSERVSAGRVTALLAFAGDRPVAWCHYGESTALAGVARGINVPNAQPNPAGLAIVNPIFTWVRLAQRVPVRIKLDRIPDGVRLVEGMTATVEVGPRGTSN